MPYWNPEDPRSAHENWLATVAEQQKQQQAMQAQAAYETAAKQSPPPELLQNPHFAKAYADELRSIVGGDAATRAFANRYAFAKGLGALGEKGISEWDENRRRQYELEQAKVATPIKVAEIDSEAKKYGYDKTTDVQKYGHDKAFESSIYGAVLGGDKKANSVSDLEIGKIAAEIYKSQTELPGQPRKNFSDIYKEVRRSMMPSIAPPLPEGISSPEPVEARQSVIQKTVGPDGTIKYSDNTIYLPNIKIGKNPSEELYKSTTPEGFKRYSNRPLPNTIEQEPIKASKIEETRSAQPTQPVQSSQLVQSSQPTSKQKNTSGFFRPLAPGDAYINRALREFSFSRPNPQNFPDDQPYEGEDIELLSNSVQQSNPWDKLVEFGGRNIHKMPKKKIPFLTDYVQGLLAK